MTQVQKGWLLQINLKRREAEILSNSENVYDALIDDFEPGMTSKKLDEIFNR